MIKLINYKDNHIKVLIKGEGKVIVLLHGYLESLDVWNNFIPKLAEKYRVVCIDLPGHGQSGIYSESHDMDFMADVVKAVLDHLQITKCLMIGHSMGGYVTLAFLEMYPHYLVGFSLLHSSPFADTKEKIQSRNREIELVKAGKSHLLYKTHVPKTYAADNIDKFKDEIERGITIANKITNEGVIAALNGMKSRPDNSTILNRTNLAFLYILGKKDQFINVDILQKIKCPENHKIVILENSGHMGFIEEKEKTLSEIIGFADNCFA